MATRRRIGSGGFTPTRASVPSTAAATGKDGARSSVAPAQPSALRSCAAVSRAGIHTVAGSRPASATPVRTAPR